MDTISTFNPRQRLENLLILLHKEILEGRGDGEIADTYRDAMDGDWYLLDSTDRSLINHLSGDLYMISDREIKRPISIGEDTEELEKQYRLAFSDGRWIDTLHILRKIHISPPHELSFIRACCWGKLGFQYAAVCFLEFSISQLLQTIP